MIRAIFFDIDGTLLASSAKTLLSTRKSISKARRQGILVGIATGRGPVHLDEQIDHIRLDAFVTYNGQLVYTNRDIIYSHPFSQETLQKLVEYADSHQRQLLFESANHMEGSGIVELSQKKWPKRFFHLIPKNLPVARINQGLRLLKKIKKPEPYENLPILKDLIYQVVMLSPMNEMPRLKALFPRCHFTRSNIITVDIIPSGGSKMIGIKKVCKHFDIPLEDVMAFGDSWNDIEMLSGVGIGIAMENSPEEVKAAADYVTASNDHDGISKAFEHFGIITPTDLLEGESRE